jgi:hypothetical protein
MQIATFLAAIAAAAAFLPARSLGASSSAAAEVERGTQPPQLVGARYQTMLALAGYLDDTAQGALEGADDDVRHDVPSEARFLSAIRSFAGSAHDLHRSIAERPMTSAELPSQLADLGQRARQLDERMRAAHALENIHDEWQAIGDVIQRMTLLLAGHDVEVPKAYVVPALSGASLQQFRGLASDLEASANQAHDKATRAVGKYRDRGEQFLGELRHFQAQSRDLRRRANAGRVDPQRVGPIVDRLLEEARQADRRMRDAQAFTEVWDDSGRSITILLRMASLVRS